MDRIKQTLEQIQAQIDHMIKYYDQYDIDALQANKEDVFNFHHIAGVLHALDQKYGPFLHPEANISNSNLGLNKHADPAASKFADQLAAKTYNAYMQFVQSSTQLDNLQDSFEELASSAMSDPAIKQWALAVLNDLRMVGKVLSRELLSRLYSDLAKKPKTAAMVDKLVSLADQFDNLGINKHADVLDQIIQKIARDEDFSDLTKLWDQPIALEDTEEGVPVRRQTTQIPEDEEVLGPLEDPEMRPEEEARLNRKMVGVEDLLPEDYTDPKYHRLDNIKRRHELMKLKKMLEQVEVGEKPDDMQDVPALKDLTPVDSFEDESKEEDAFDEAEKEIADEQEKLSLDEYWDEHLNENNAKDDPEYEDPDNDPFDTNLGLLDVSDPYQGMSLKKILKERPASLPSGPMSDEELEDVRKQENTEEELNDEIEDMIYTIQGNEFKPSGAALSAKEMNMFLEDLNKKIDDALENNIISSEQAEEMQKKLEPFLSAPRVSKNKLVRLVDLIKTYGTKWKNNDLLEEIIDDMWEMNVKILPKTMLENKHIPQKVRDSAQRLLKDMEISGSESELSSFMSSMGSADDSVFDMLIEAANEDPKAFKEVVAFVKENPEFMKLVANLL